MWQEEAAPGIELITKRALATDDSYAIANGDFEVVAAVTTGLSAARVEASTGLPKKGENLGEPAQKYLALRVATIVVKISAAALAGPSALKYRRQRRWNIPSSTLNVGTRSSF